MVDDERVVVHEIEFGDVGVLFVDQHQREGAQDVHGFDGLAQFVDAGFEHRLNLGVEVLVGVVDPLFYDATRDLVVVIVEDTNLSAVLCDENVQIGESRFSAFRTAFFGRFLQRAFDLM